MTGDRFFDVFNLLTYRLLKQIKTFFTPGLAVVALLTAVITFSVGGLNKRGTATFAGSMMGVLLTCFLAVWFTGSFRLHGAVRPFSETLLLPPWWPGFYTGEKHLDARCRDEKLSLSN